MTSKMNVVFFRRMEKDTVEDYQFLYHLEQNYIRGLPVQILAAMAELKSSLSGYQICRLEHSLQTPTRAERDGANIELIVKALIHDIGDALPHKNLLQMAAAIIRPRSVPT